MQSLNLSAIKKLLNGLYIATSNQYKKRVLPPAVLTIGSSKILKYDGDGKKPILVVPSLINGPEILDHCDQESFMLSLVEKGMTPYLIDWGVPDAAELGFTITDYVKRIIQFSEYIYNKNGVHKIAGYCLGGHLALASALLRPQFYKDLTVIATGWGFGDAYDVMRTRSFVRLIEGCEEVVSSDFLRAMFYSKDPFKSIEKYMKLADGLISANDFISVESWAMSPMPVAKGVFLEVVKSWIRDDALVRDIWYLDEFHLQVNPAHLELDVLCIVGKYDAISRSSDCLLLHEKVRRGYLKVLDTGHIGLVTSQKDASVLAIAGNSL